MSGLTHQHSPRWPLVDMLHWEEERKKTHTNADTLKNSGGEEEGVEGGAVGAQWEA